MSGTLSEERALEMSIITRLRYNSTQELVQRGAKNFLPRSQNFKLLSAGEIEFPTITSKIASKDADFSKTLNGEFRIFYQKSQNERRGRL